MSKKEKIHKNQTIERKQERARPKVVLYSKQTGPPPFLYRLVYGSAYSVVICFVLMLSFVGQGIYVVHAAEEIDTATTLPVSGSVDDAMASESIETSSELPVETDNLSDPEELEDYDEENNLESEESGAEVNLTDISSQENLDESENESASSSLDNLPVASSSTAESEEVDEEDSSEDDLPVANEETATTSNNASSTSESVAIEDTASTSEPVGPIAPEAVSVSFSDNQLIFNKNECTEIATGSFYCIPPTDSGLEDALYSAPDKDGDLEIFLVRGGSESQITNNEVDDAAAFFDQNSNTLVWHRLLDDRYQIISYDIESGEEKQLTSGSQNNMEPTRQGKYTVWQRWTDNNWDIVMFDGKNEVQISHSSAHDIAPYIHGTLLAWNRYTPDGEKTIEMYDINTETYVTVNDPEGLSVSNPRMVFVYDSLHPNGDIVTRGFDMISRQFIQLDTLPRELPEEIPKSEPTSETRALIQSKPTLKGDEAVVIDITSDPDPEADEVTASSTDSLTINIKPKVASSTPDTTFDSDDLIIPSLADMGSSSVQTE